MKKAIIETTAINILFSFSLFCSNEAKISPDVANSIHYDYETFQFSSDDEQILSSINTKNEISTTYRNPVWNNYSCCPEPYKQWSCKERCDNAACCIAVTAGSLGLREFFALLLGCLNPTARSGDINCSTAHQFMWCTVEQWFPIEHTSDSILCCAHALCDASTIITTGSALYTCCILSPCITKDGCICER